MFGKGSSNHGAEWNTHMDADLTRLFCQGKSIKQLAEEHFFRTENAIRCRLRLLGYRLEVDGDMSKAPNRYLILGVRDGHVQRLVSRRGSTPDEAITQALRAEDIYARTPRGADECLILVSIKDASDDVGAPLNTDVQVIEREPPTPPYRLVSLSRQGC